MGAVNVAAAEARAKGLLTFTIDRPCRYGHHSPRYVSSRNCVACVKERVGRCRTDIPGYRVAHDAKYRRENPRPNTEKERARRALWEVENRDLCRANSARRRAIKNQACPAWADLDAIEAVYREAKWLEAETGLYHDVDHIVPLRGRNVCGLHVHWNLRAIPASENARKGNRLT